MKFLAETALFNLIWALPFLAYTAFVLWIGYRWGWRRRQKAVEAAQQQRLEASRYR